MGARESQGGRQASVRLGRPDLGKVRPVTRHLRPLRAAVGEYCTVEWALKKLDVGHLDPHCVGFDIVPHGQPGTDHDLSASTLAHFISADFRATWDAVAGLPVSVGSRGNFMFARQAMSLIELAGRTCAADPSGQALADLSRELERIERRYFTPLPGLCARPGMSRGQIEWTLPFNPSSQPQEAQLLWALFDLVRHGQAHQYQQIMVELRDATIWGVSLTGPTLGRTLASVEQARPANHLSQMPGVDGSLWLVIYPEALFLDFDLAIQRAGVFQRQLEPTPLTRKAIPGGKWDFDQGTLEQQLRVAGHPDWTPPAEEPIAVAAVESTESGEGKARQILARIRRCLPL